MVVVPFDLSVAHYSPIAREDRLPSDVRVHIEPPDFEDFGVFGPARLLCLLVPADPLLCRCLERRVRGLVVGDALLLGLGVLHVLVLALDGLLEDVAPRRRASEILFEVLGVDHLCVCVRVRVPAIG